MQQFGHGAPEGCAFQTEKLRECINDVGNVSIFLAETYGYKNEDIVILTDDQQQPMGRPTKQNILYLPVDFKQAGRIVDDEMHHILVKPLLPGMRLTAIFDFCHFGSTLHLPFIYSTKGILKEPNLAKEAAQGLLAAFTAYASGDLGGVASSVLSLGKKAMAGDDAYEHIKDTRTSPTGVGERDHRKSTTGAISYAFISALRANPQQSYVQLLNSIQDVLETNYTKLAQLSAATQSRTAKRANRVADAAKKTDEQSATESLVDAPIHERPTEQGATGRQCQGPQEPRRKQKKRRAPRDTLNAGATPATDVEMNLTSRAAFISRRTNSLPVRIDQSTAGAASGTIPTYVPIMISSVPGDNDAEDDDENNHRHMSRTSVTILLLASTGLVAVCAKFMVDLINKVVSGGSDISEAFIA
ncbi:hypothetical protein DL767_006033 [Monosporascus sp. MG133]|nr:hypothetical protein DL767_006033 [Monosporascus sp. MG133]